MEELMLLESKLNDQKQEVYYIQARKLAERLGFTKSQIKRWIDRNIINNECFEEGKDYRCINCTTKQNKTVIDCELSLKTAKKLCFLTKNKYSEKIFDYFEECESRLRQQQMTVPYVNIPPRQIAAILIKQEEEKERLQQQVALITLQSKGKAQRQELSSKVSNLVRTVAKEAGVPYDRVWRRLYRQFNANHHRVWWGASQQAKNHWEYITKNATLEDLRFFLDYALSYLEEINRNEFWVD